MNKIILWILVFDIIFCQNIYNAVNYLTEYACLKSVGLCAKYVANALEFGGKFSFQRQPSAYLYHTNGILKKIGFTEIENPDSFNIGDITVTEQNNFHAHGHIAMWNGNQWISDFLQKTEFVYSHHQPKVHYYRYGNVNTKVNTIDNSGFSISQEGINLITYFEGCYLTAYWDKYGKIITIGYGHTGKDVYNGMTITKAQAVNLLKKDLQEHENYVKNINFVNIQLNQNQFDALTSFSFNVGPKNLKELCYGKSASEIANKITLYNKAKGVVLRGLTERRKAEKALFLKSSSTPIPAPKPPATPINPKIIPFINKLVKFTYAVKISSGRILPEVVNDNDYAGKIGFSIIGVAIKVNIGRVKYRVHVVGGNWLEFVDGYNWDDYTNGYAGNGKAIDLIQIV